MSIMQDQVGAQEILMQPKDMTIQELFLNLRKCYEELLHEYPSDHRIVRLLYGCIMELSQRMHNNHEMPTSGPGDDETIWEPMDCEDAGCDVLRKECEQVLLQRSEPKLV